MRIALLGLGLIGGSIARALRRAEVPAEIRGWTPAGRGPEAALTAGFVDAAPRSLADAVIDAELIVLAAPPLDCAWLLDELAGPMRYARSEGSTITDVASTKASIVARANERGVPFVGGHPMAGRETTGFGAATDDLFDGRPWVVVPGVHARPTDVERVEWLARAVGARPIRMAADAHDRAVAGISHLPLVLAAALVESVAGRPGAPVEGWDVARVLAASGWRDMTRLARGDLAMGAGIAVSNAGELAGRIRDVRSVLDRWLADLDPTAGGPDLAAIEGRLADAKTVLEEPTPGAAPVTPTASKPPSP